MGDDKIKHAIQQKAENKGFLSDRDTMCKKIVKKYSDTKISSNFKKTGEEWSTVNDLILFGGN